MSRRAIQKKLVKKFKVGDVVTWGNKLIAHRVTMVCRDGVYVDSTATNYGEPMRDGRRRVFVPYVTRRQHGIDIGPPEHTTMSPDVNAR